MRATNDSSFDTSFDFDSNEDNSACVIKRLCSQLHGHISFLLRLAKTPELQSLFLISQQTGDTFLPETSVRLIIEQASKTAQFLDNINDKYSDNPIPSIEEQLGFKYNGKRRLHDIKKFVKGESMNLNEMKEMLWQEIVINDILRRMLEKNKSKEDISMIKKQLKKELIPKIESKLRQQIKQERESQIPNKEHEEFNKNDIELIKLKKEIAKELKPKLESKIRSELEYSLREEIKDELTPQIESRLNMKLKAKLMNEIKPQIASEMKESIKKEYIPKIKKKLQERNNQKLRAEIENELRPILISELKPILIKKLKEKIKRNMEDKTFVEKGEFKLSRKGDDIKLNLNIK